jgi:hypothetical protein
MVLVLSQGPFFVAAGYGATAFDASKEPLACVESNLTFAASAVEADAG